MLAGLVQGMVTGMRGLCNGIGPAMFGVIFYLFHVDLNDDPSRKESGHDPNSSPDYSVAPQVIDICNDSD